MLCSIRVIDYYIHRNKIFENGHSEVGTITNIKTLGFHRNDFVYYLIIDFNGKQIRSLCFLDNIYSIGEDINVLVYKNHNYVILKNQYFYVQYEDALKYDENRTVILENVVDTIVNLYGYVYDEELHIYWQTQDLYDEHKRYQDQQKCNELKTKNIKYVFYL